MLTIIDLFARFHPVLVHLPIGILLLACFFQWLTIKSRFASLHPAVPVALFWGMISAIASCISGFLLSRSGDYDRNLVNWHQWMGISVVVISGVLYFLKKSMKRESVVRWVSSGLILAVIITGHLGGSLTHGTDYLSAAFKGESLKGPAIQPIANIQEASVYTDMVQPLLQARCYTCHGASKQKGKLRLDEPSFIVKGGESGKTVVAGKPGESEMIERIMLPRSNEDHMPPKEKPQLTSGEITLLHWWISNGADFNRKVKELEQDDKIKPVLLALQSGSVTGNGEELTGIPREEVEKANEKVVQQLRQAGVIVMPVIQGSNYLSVNFVAAVSAPDSIFRLLSQLKKQLVWLKLDYTSAGDKSISYLADCSSLTRLYLSNTQITDKGLNVLQSLHRLQLLNLVGTAVTAPGIRQLQGLKKLKNIYLFKTGIDSSDWADLKKIFPGTQLDFGNYRVPTLAEDTTEIKY